MARITVHVSKGKGSPSGHSIPPVLFRIPDKKVENIESVRTNLIPFLEVLKEYHPYHATVWYNKILKMHDLFPRRVHEENLCLMANRCIEAQEEEDDGLGLTFAQFMNDGLFGSDATQGWFQRLWTDWLSLNPLDPNRNNAHFQKKRGTLPWNPFNSEVTWNPWVSVDRDEALQLPPLDGETSLRFCPHPILITPSILLSDPEHYLFLETIGDRPAFREKTLTLIQGHVNMDHKSKGMLLNGNNIASVIDFNAYRELNEEVKFPSGKPIKIPESCLKSLEFLWTDLPPSNRYLGVLYRIDVGDVRDIVSNEPEKHKVVILPKDQIHTEYHRFCPWTLQAIGRTESIHQSYFQFLNRLRETLYE